MGSNMTNPNDPAFPPSGEMIKIKNALTGDPLLDFMAQSGLTKREYFAAMAMQGFIGTHNDLMKLPNETNDSALIRLSLEYTDALIKELSR